MPCDLCDSPSLEFNPPITTTLLSSTHWLSLCRLVHHVLQHQQLPLTRLCVTFAELEPYVEFRHAPAGHQPTIATPAGEGGGRDKDAGAWRQLDEKETAPSRQWPSEAGIARSRLGTKVRLVSYPNFNF